LTTSSNQRENYSRAKCSCIETFVSIYKVSQLGFQIFCKCHNKLGTFNIAANVDGLLPGWLLCSVRPANEPGL